MLHSDNILDLQQKLVCYRWLTRYHSWSQSSSLKILSMRCEGTSRSALLSRDTGAATPAPSSSGIKSRLTRCLTNCCSAHATCWGEKWIYAILNRLKSMFWYSVIYMSFYCPALAYLGFFGYRVHQSQCPPVTVTMNFKKSHLLI
jgi:hypothetical protein